MRSEPSDEDAVQKTKIGPLSFLPERTCAICYQDQNPGSTSEAEILGANTGAGGVIGSATTDIVNPYETIPCRCIYCFVCITTKIEAEEGSGWTCLRCGETIYRCKPWNGDVLEEKKSAKNGKSVGFSDEEVAASRNQEPNTVMQGANSMISAESGLDSSQWTMTDPG